jgi:glycerol-3-phosphate dehydrogenase
VKRIDTGVLVIGGGSTGAGVVRDLALRGVASVLVDRGDLAEGTTGRFHGLLHSGARYAVKDPRAAEECRQENAILRRVAADCIEDCGGYFVETPWDEPGYAERFLAGCAAAGIPCEELPAAEALRAEPALHPGIRRVFAVPDAAVDPWKTVWACARSAGEHGASILVHHRVERLILEGDRVAGAACRNALTGELVEIHAEVIVNAAGAWSGQIAAMAGCEVTILPGKGVLLAMNHRLTGHVVNRCRLPGDGDIIVPIRTVSVIGTTDIASPDPDESAITRPEVDLMLDEGERLLPGLRRMRVLRAWAGVRPLFQETRGAPSSNREVSRWHHLLDHAARDGVGGFVTITGGKFTTFRMMAEITADLVAERLGVTAPCRTAIEALPGSEPGRHYRLGARLADREATLHDDQLICECELVPRRRLEEAMNRRPTGKLDDLRRAMRLGMGPCQGGFCIYRATGLLHAREHLSAPEANQALGDFLQERWKGVAPVAFGDQLRQARLDEWIFQGLLGVDHLAGAGGPDGAGGGDGAAGAVAGDGGGDGAAGVGAGDGGVGAGHRRAAAPGAVTAPGPGGGILVSFDVVVIGAGLAGMSAATRLAEGGAKVCVVARGPGSMNLSPVTVDVLGFAPGLVADPGAALGQLAAERPGHPYAVAGPEAVSRALEWFLAELGGYPYTGGLGANLLLPSAVGSLRPSAAVPETMAAGDLRRGGRFAIVGFRALKDFYPHYLADNLQRAVPGVVARGIVVDPPMGGEADVSPLGFARRFEDTEFRKALLAALDGQLEAGESCGFPAVLGLDGAAQVHAEAQDLLGAPVFEIPTPPPSVAGLRVFRLLKARILRAGGRVTFGGRVAGTGAGGPGASAGGPGASAGAGRIGAVSIESAGHPTALRARWFVLATGGFASGGFELDSSGSVTERVFGLPLSGVPADRGARFSAAAFGPHPIARAGIATDAGLRPVDTAGRRLYENLLVAGAALAGADPVPERSGDGIALATGHRAAELILGEGP